MTTTELGPAPGHGRACPQRRFAGARRAAAAATPSGRHRSPAAMLPPWRRRQPPSLGPSAGSPGEPRLVCRSCPTSERKVASFVDGCCANIDVLPASAVECVCTWPQVRGAVAVPELHYSTASCTTNLQRAFYYLAPSGSCTRQVDGAYYRCNLVRIRAAIGVVAVVATSRSDTHEPYNQVMEGEWRWPLLLQPRIKGSA